MASELVNELASCCTNHTEVGKHLVVKGWEQEGHGYFSTVYAREDRAFKVTTPEPDWAWAEFIYFTQHVAEPSPLWPKVYGIEHMKHFTLCEMERLAPLKILPSAVDLYFNLMKQIGLRQMHKSEKDIERDLPEHQRHLASGVYQYNQYVKGASTDLHCDNMMLRLHPDKAPDIVITDPFAFNGANMSVKHKVQGTRRQYSCLCNACQGLRRRG